VSTSGLGIENEKPIEGLEGFVEKFLGDRLSEFEKLRSDLSSEKYDEIRALAHNWKGFCDPYGFQGLGKLAISLEEKAIAKDKNGCEEVFRDMDLYLKAKKQHISGAGI